MSDFKYFSKSEYKKLIATIKRDKAMEADRDLQWITIMRYTGIRLCVMRQLTLADAKNCLAKGRFICRAETNKGGVRSDGTVRASKKVNLMLVESVEKALIELIALNNEQEREFVDNTSDALVLSRRGKNFAARSYQDRFAYWKNKADFIGCDDVTVHGLRHTYAVMWLKTAKAQTGDSLRSVKQLQKNMNHSNITSTMIYLSQMGKEELELIEQAAGR